MTKKYGFLFSVLVETVMPGIDFRQLRADITMAQVLELLGLSSSSDWATRCGGNVHSMNHPSEENTAPFRLTLAATCSVVSNAERRATILTSGPGRARNQSMKPLSISALA